MLAVAARARIDHERNRVVLPLAVVVIEGAKHDVRNLVGAMRPDIDDLVVAFAGSDDTLAILLFHFADLLLRRLDLLILFLRDDHVVDPDRNAGPRRFAEADFLQPIQRGNSFFVPANLVATPDQIT